MQELRKEIGQRVQDRMDELGIKQKDLVSLSGLAKSTVSKVVNGETNPSAEILLALSKALEVSVDWIVKGEENPVSNKELKLFNSKWDMKDLDKKLDCSEKDFIIKYVDFSVAKKQLHFDLSEEVDSIKEEPVLFSVTEKQKNKEEIVKIPILGTAAAGVPIDVVRFVEGYLKVDPKYKDCFAVKVKGDSMINIGILNGGIVVVRQQEWVENNEIALVMVDNQVTIKRFKLDRDKAILISENDHMQPLIYNKNNEMKILGKVLLWLPEEQADIKNND